MTRPPPPTRSPGSAAPAPAFGISSGAIGSPLRLLLLGMEKVGKTSFAAGAPAPIFLDAEAGSGFLDVPRLDFGGGRLAPQSLDEIRQVIKWLGDSDHDRRTLVIDTADALEAIVWGDLCRRNNWATIEAPGYGKGYVAALEDWRRILAGLDWLRVRKQMAVILVAHVQIRNFANPAGDDYSRFEPCLHRQTSNILKGWADCILFASHEDMTDRKTGKVVTSGNRVLRTQRDPAWDAGNRLGLPPMLPLDWSAFASAARLDGVMMHAGSAGEKE